MLISSNTVRFSPWPGLFLAGAAAVFTGLSVLLYWPEPEAAFLSDQSPISWLSSAQLWAAGVLCLRLAADRVLPRGLALWLGLALIGLATDEQFMFHERWKYGCHAWLAVCRDYLLVRELPTLLVGGLGVASALWLHRALPGWPARGFLWSAIAVGLSALGIDLLGGSEFLAAYEEAFEVVAETLFAATLLGLAPGRRQVHSP